MDDTLQAFLKLIQDLPSRKEFLTTFGSVVERFKRFEAALTRDFDTLRDTIVRLAEKTFYQLSERNDKAFTSLQTEIKAASAQAFKEQQNTLNFIRDKARELKPGQPGRDGVDGKDGKDGRDGKDGKDGKNAKDTDPSLIVSQVLKEIETRLQQIDKRASRIQTPAKAYRIITKDVPSHCEETSLVMMR